MKGKLQSSKNKRMIALVAILVVLLAGTVTGVTLFLKDDGSTSATAYNEISNNTIQEPTNSTTGQEEQTIPTDEDEQQTIPTDENQQQETTSEQTTPEGQGNQETTTSNNQENTENNNADSQTTPEESITYADRLVSEDFLVGWTPIGLATIADTTGRYLNNTKLEIEKISYTETDFTNNTEISLPEQSKYNSVQSGERIVYEIRVKNTSNVVAKNIKIIDKIPEGIIVEEIDSNGTLKNENVQWVSDIPAGEQVSFKFVAVVEENVEGTIQNIAVVNGDATNTVHNPVLKTEKIAEVTRNENIVYDAAKPGDTINYTIQITNTGNVDAVTKVTDQIPANTTLVENSITDNGIKTNGNIDWDEVIVKPGETKNIEFKVTVNKDVTGSIKNIAVVGETPTNETENLSANITGSKTADKTEAKVGETIKYTITLTNSGNAAGKVTVTDKIPEGTTIKDETIEGYNKETNEMVWEEVEVAAGGRVELTLEVVVNKDTTTSVINTATIDEEEIPDKPETKIANITGSKTADKTEAKVGETIKYTITLTNSGNAAGKVTVTDKIPEGTTYVEKSVDEKGTYNKTTNTIEWKDIEVKPQNPVELTFNVKVKPFENGETEKEIANQASIGNKVVDKADKKYIEKEISKVWENDNETLRNDIIVEIYANNVKTNKTLTLQAEEQWKGTFKNLPKYDSAGKEIVYTIKEVNVPEGYTSTVNGMTITNTYAEPTVTKTVKKEWIGDSENIILRQGITVEILADGKEERTIVLNTTNNWTATITGLQKYKTGTRTPIKYTLNEITKLEGYQTTYDITQEGELIVKNIYVEPTVTKTARKTWEGDNVNLRPESITVQLLANGNEVSGKTAILTAGNNWTAEFTGLQKYETGTIKEVKYSIAEVDVPDGYTCRVDTKDSMHLINTYIEPTISKTVTKEWVDNNDLLQERPTSIKIQLKDNTGYVWAEQVITSANKGKDTNTWSWTFTDLPKYDSNNADRKQIIYIVDEAEVQTGDLKYYTKAINNNKIVNTIKVPNIVSTKTATTSADEKTKLINENAVQVGDTITYTIKIENKGEIYKTVTVRDTIPEKTTLQGSIKLDGVDLTEEQVNQLYEGTLALTISEGTYKTITFTVKVVSGNAGDSVINTAYVDNEAVGPVENPIEKFVNVTKYKNNVGSTNILLVLDTSSSMVNNKVNGQTRLKIAKDAIIDFITKTYEKEANKDVTFTLVTFNKRENTKVFTFGNNNSYIATKDTATAFKTAISKITNGNGTNMRAGLEVAYTTLFGSDGNGGIAGMPQYKDYEQIMIFFGDGEPSGETNLLNNAAGIKAKADEIRAKAKVYAIGFGADAATPGKVGYERLKDIGGGVVYTSNNYTQLVTNFSEIISADPEYKQVTVNGNAIVEITNSQNIVVDGDKNKIILTVGDKNIEITNSTEAAANYLTYTDKKITWDVSSYSSESILKISYHVQ